MGIQQKQQVDSKMKDTNFKFDSQNQFYDPLTLNHLRKRNN